MGGDCLNCFQYIEPGTSHEYVEMWECVVYRNGKVAGRLRNPEHPRTDPGSQ